MSDFRRIPVPRDQRQLKFFSTGNVIDVEHQILCLNARCAISRAAAFQVSSGLQGVASTLKRHPYGRKCQTATKITVSRRPTLFFPRQGVGKLRDASATPASRS
jgi:hypothetical protein